MDDTSQLSPGGAVAMGTLFIASGLFPILMSLGILPSSGGEGTPSWVGTCAGLMFIAAGVSVIIDYGIAGGVGPDGDLKPGTPFGIRVANLVLGLAIIGMMSAVFGWVAFGPGPRTFSSTLSLPFMTKQWLSGELTGRIAFGIATVLMVLMWIACGVVGVKRLLRVR
jgi:hypothetical protein